VFLYSISANALEGTVQDRMTISEALAQNVISNDEYTLAKCSQYTHVDALFWYDDSRAPKFVDFTRRVSESDPYKWERESVSNLSCEKKSPPIPSSSTGAAAVAR